jgi:hypothetical protein
VAGLFCAGCPGKSGDILTRRGDAQQADAHIGDGRADAEVGDGLAPIACLPWTDATQLQPPEPLSGINTAYDETEPFLTADGLRLFFASDRPGGQGGQDVYVAERATPTEPFGNVTNYAPANTADDDGGLALAPDGLTAYLSSTRPGGEGEVDIWSATRADLSVPFAANDFAPLASVSGPGRDFDPTPSADGLRLYFTTDGVVAANSLADLVVAERATPTGTFGAPQPVPGVNLPDGHEGNPALSGDQLLIVFNSMRAGGPGPSDLWYATRADRDAAFSTPRLVPTVNTADSENEAFLTPDGCWLYFRRKQDLYRARVIPGRGGR